MHHHPDILRQAMRAREGELHARAARMTAAARVSRRGAGPVADAEPALPAAPRRALWALVAELARSRPRSARHPAE